MESIKLSDEEKKIRKKLSDARCYQNNKLQKMAAMRIYYQENKEKLNAKNSEWVKNNRQTSNSYKAKYRENNKEKVKIYYKKYYLENKDNELLRLKKWALDNPEKKRASCNKWHANNQGVVRSIRHNRRARIKKVGGTISVDLIDRLLKLQSSKCACCKNKLTKFHMDHIIPIALNGENTDLNIQLLCPKCNLQKSAKHPIDFMQSKGYLL